MSISRSRHFTGGALIAPAAPVGGVAVIAGWLLLVGGAPFLRRA